MRDELKALRKQLALLECAIRALEDVERLRAGIHDLARQRSGGKLVAFRRHAGASSRKGELIHLRKRSGG